MNLIARLKAVAAMAWSKRQVVLSTITSAFTAACTYVKNLYVRLRGKNDTQ